MFLERYYVVHVEGAIFKHGRYLIVRRSPSAAHAPGSLSLVGGRTRTDSMDNVLENTLRNEIREAVGLEVQREMVYIESKAFITDDGDPLVDVVFLCRWQSGRALITDTSTFSEIRWLTASEILYHPAAPLWTRRSIELAEHRRQIRGW